VKARILSFLVVIVAAAVCVFYWYFLVRRPVTASGKIPEVKWTKYFRKCGRILHIADGGNGWDALHRGKQDVCDGRFKRFAVGISH